MFTYQLCAAESQWEHDRRSLLMKVSGNQHLNLVNTETDDEFLPKKCPWKLSA